MTGLSSLRSSVADVLGSRDLLYELVRRDIRIRYKQAVMGFAWALFMPILVVLSGLVVRLIMSQFGSGDVDRAVVGGLALKAVPWGFVVGGLGFTTTSLVNNRELVTKIAFPREVLPLAALLAQTFDSSVAAVGIAVVLPFLGLTFSPALLWVPVLVALIFLLTLAGGLALSCANVFFRDVRYLVQVILTFGIFFTPVFFEPTMLGGLGSRLVMLNPFAPLLEGLRLAVIEGQNLLGSIVTTSGAEQLVEWHPWYLLYSAAWTFGGLALAARLFRNGVASFAEYA